MLAGVFDYLLPAYGLLNQHSRSTLNSPQTLTKLMAIQYPLMTFISIHILPTAPPYSQMLLQSPREINGKNSHKSPSSQ